MCERLLLHYTCGREVSKDAQTRISTIMLNDYCRTCSVPSRTGSGIGDLPVAVYVGRGDQSLPVRLFWRFNARVPLHAAVRARVIEAQRRQLERFKAEKKTYSNAQMASKMIRKHCAINADGEKLLENAVTRLGLSARAHDRILKVSRTIADLDASPNIETKHLSEAIQYRTLDRNYRA
jgi:Magnesium chelatase, subunit ChlI C-terminal